MTYADFKRWLYQGGRPNLLARALNRGWAAIHALGIAPNHLVTLEVAGRRSGKSISFPLAMVVLDGERYLVSMLGAHSSWVHNVRAAGGHARMVHGRTELVLLEEVAIEQRPRILKAYLKLAPGARPHIPVDRDAPLEDFAAVAPQIPVFRIQVEPGTTPRTSPLRFFGLVFALSIPFWAIGVLTARELLPALPISALAVLCPVTAAAILSFRRDGRAGVTALLRRSFDFGRIQSKGWLVIALLLEPFIMALSFLVMRLAGVPAPVPQIAPLRALALFAVFFLAALAEELGWSGFAVDPMQDRIGALGTSLIIGLVWAGWHFVGLAQANRSVGFIAWWSLCTLAYRVIIVWLYNNTGGSVFVAATFHAMINLTWQLFPVNGSFYDPRITGLIAVVAACFMVTVWNPQTLTRKRLILTGRQG